VEAPADLSEGERALLDDAASDDVALVWVLIHLGIRGNPPRPPDWKPSATQLDAAFDAMRRLVDAGLLSVGRTEYLDGGPPGRFAPVRHVAEPLDDVRRRVDAAVREAKTSTDWEFACWVTKP
jgi:hypothetical protein